MPAQGGIPSEREREREVELRRACSFITAPSGVTVLKRLVSVRAAPVGTCPPMFFLHSVLFCCCLLCVWMGGDCGGHRMQVSQEMFDEVDPTHATAR